MLEYCMSGDVCEEEAVESTTFPGVRRFCQGHQEGLDTIREMLEEGAWERNVRNKEGSVERFCETLGCEERPIYGNEYCDECLGVF